MDICDVICLKGFKIAHINCRSILNKINEISYTFQGIDILTCSETCLCRAIPDNLVEIAGMDMFRYDRDNGHGNGTVKLRGGGFSCYIRKDLKLNASICAKYSHVSRDIEILTLKCKYEFNKIVYFIVIYRPPGGSHEEFFKVLSEYIDSGNLSNNDLYICGDFKIDFLHRNDVKTKSLITFLRTQGLKQHITLPTRVTGFSKSCIDFIVSNLSDKLIVAAGPLNCLVSDHYPVFICVKKQRNQVKFL